jgi:GntR family histidine utilization transcriptional repressor
MEREQDLHIEEFSYFHFGLVRKLMYRCYSFEATGGRMIETGKTGYRAVKAEILNRIRARVWPSGHAIPSEMELAEEFGCARGTINRAMLELQEEGVIDRKRRAGTRVAIAPVRQAKLEIPLVRVEIESTGAAYRYELISREEVTAPEWLKARLSLPGKSKAVHVRCLHFAGNAPFQFEDRWINIAAVPQVVDETFEANNPNEWLVEAVPFTNAEFAFFAGAADSELASLLGAAKGEPVFVAERTTWLGNVPVTFARMSFRSSYRMVSRI